MLLRQIPIKELINAKLLSLFMHHSSQLLVSTIRINLIVFRVGRPRLLGWCRGRAVKLHYENESPSNRVKHLEPKVLMNILKSFPRHDKHKSHLANINWSWFIIIKPTIEIGKGAWRGMWLHHRYQTMIYGERWKKCNKFWKTKNKPTFTSEDRKVKRQSQQ